MSAKRSKRARAVPAVRAIADVLERRLLLSADDLPLMLQEVSTSSAEPPPGFEAFLAGSDQSLQITAGSTSKVLTNVPTYIWYNGCAPTSASMIFGYWDTWAYPNMFTTTDATVQANVNDQIASPEHIADYATKPDAPLPHHADNSVADFLGTSRDPLNWGWSYRSNYPSGFEDYAAWRGYNYADAFNRDWGVVTFDDITNEIDYLRPFLISVDSDGNGSSDHAMAGIGYRTSPSSQFAAYTTWNGMPGVQWFDWEGIQVGDPFGVTGVTFFRPSASRPDLVPITSNVSPEPLTWGDSLSYTWSINNMGGVNAGASTAKFYMSSNSTISSADYLLGSISVASLVAYSTRSGVTSLTLPATPPAGFSAEDTLYIGIIVDSENVIAEGSETNNTSPYEFQGYDAVAVSTKPDLIGTGFELSMPVLNFGETDASFQIKNQGRTSAGGFYVRFYLSSNTSVSTADTLLATQYVSSLGANATFSDTITLTVPTTAPVAGDNTWTIGMLIDATGLVTEADEVNNSNEGFGIDKADAAYGTRIVSADFDHGDGAMDIRNDTAWAPVDGLWHISRALPTHAMYYGVEKTGDYDVGDSAGVFLTKNISLPDGPVALSFSHSADVEKSTLVDQMSVQVYDVVADSYTTILSKGSGLSFNTGGFQQVIADLSPWAGSVVRLRWAFDTVNAANNSGAGWFVDNIAVWGRNNAVTVEAYRSLRYDSNLTHLASYLNWAGDHDSFVFNEEQLDGTFAIATTSAAAVRPALAIYDYQTGEMLYMDSGASAGSEALINLPNSGRWNTYLVEAWDVEEDSTGNLDVSVNGSGTAVQSVLSVDASGHAELLNRLIDNDTDTDFYRVVAPPDASGDLTILVSPLLDSGLLPRLQVWKGLDHDSPDRIAANNQGPTEATFTGVQPGDTFYIAVADNDFSLGGGANVGRFDLTADFSTALPATLTGDQAQWFAYFDSSGVCNDALSGVASISPATDIDSWVFAGDTGWTGSYTIQAIAPAGSGVTPVVAVYDGTTGARLGAAAAVGNTATLTLTLNELTRYVVAVADDNLSDTGALDIVITAPGTGAVGGIALDAAGDGASPTYSTGSADTDFFSFVAPGDTNGNLTIVVDPSDTLDVAFALFNASGTLLGHRYANAAGANEELSISGLTPGATYHLSVLGNKYQTTGTFVASLNFDLIVPDQVPLPMDIWATANQFGDINITGGAGPSEWNTLLTVSDMSDTSATFTAEANGAGIVPIIGLYDFDTGQRLAWSTNPTNATSTSFTASVNRWTRYYVAAGTKGATSGSVRTLIDFATPGTLTPTIGDDGQGTSPGFLDDPADIDYYRFTAPDLASGALSVSTTGADPSLRSSLALYDSTGRFLTSAGAAAAGADTTLTYDSVTPGEQYAVAVTSRLFNTGSGVFTFNIDFGLAVPATIDPADARYDWQPNQFGDEQLIGNLTAGELVEMWAIRPEAAGPIELSLLSTAYPAALGLFDATGTRLAGDMVTVAGDTASISYAGAANTIYYIFVSSRSGADTGGYTLTMDVPSFPAIGSIPIDVTGGGSLGSSASPIADQDYFSIVAPLGAFSVDVTMTPSAALAPSLRLYDTAGSQHDFDGSIGPGAVVSVSSAVTGGSAYLVGVSGENLTTGTYTIDVQFKLTPGIISTTTGSDSVYVRRDPLDPALVQVYVNAPLAGPPTFSYTLASLPKLVIATLAGKDELTVDFNYGDPVPFGGISYDGGPDPDTLTVLGAGSGAGVYTPHKSLPGSGTFAVDGSTITFTGLEPLTVSNLDRLTLVTPNGKDDITVDRPAAGVNRITGTSGGVAFESIAFSGIGTLRLDLATGEVAGADDVLTIDGPTGLGVALMHGGGDMRVDVASGSPGFTNDLRDADLSVYPGAQATLVNTQHLRSLAIDHDGSVRFAAGPSYGLFADNLVIGGLGATMGSLDLADGELILSYAGSSPYNTVRDWIGAGSMTGRGIFSSTAPATPASGLALVDNAMIHQTTWEGHTVSAGVDYHQVMTKLTPRGDTNLDGAVTQADYNGVIANMGLTDAHWLQGDLNYDSVVTVDDLAEVTGNLGAVLMAPALASAAVPAASAPVVTTASAPQVAAAAPAKQAARAGAIKAAVQTARRAAQQAEQQGARPSQVRAWLKSRLELLGRKLARLRL